MTSPSTRSPLGSQPLRAGGARDTARCEGERRLLVALLRDALACLHSEELREREAARSWFELGGVGLFSLHDAAHYLALDPEAVRREAERLLSKECLKQKG